MIRFWMLGVGLIFTGFFAGEVQAREKTPGENVAHMMTDTKDGLHEREIHEDPLDRNIYSKSQQDDEEELELRRARDRREEEAKALEERTRANQEAQDKLNEQDTRALPNYEPAYEPAGGTQRRSAWDDEDEDTTPSHGQGLKNLSKLLDELE